MRRAAADDARSATGPRSEPLGHETQMFKRAVGRYSSGGSTRTLALKATAKSQGAFGRSMPTIDPFDESPGVVVGDVDEAPE